MNADLGNLFEMWQAWSKNRRTGKFNLELLLGKVQKLIQIQFSPVGMMDKPLVGASRRFLLVRTSHQTFGTAKEVIANLRRQLRRYIGIGLDSKIADTFSGVE